MRGVPAPSRPGGFRLAPRSLRPQGPETSPWYWHPGRVGVRSGPAWFERELEAVDAELRVTWNPITQRYQLFAPKPSLRSKLVWGWTLLFTFHPTEIGAPVIARLYEASARKWGNGRDYFRAIERELERDKEKQEASSRQAVVDQAMESFDHSQIRVGYGKSSGSKFSTYHA